MEVAVSWKFRKDTGNLTDAPTPVYIWGPWAFITVFCIFKYIQLRFGSRVTTPYGESQWEKERVKAIQESSTNKPPAASKTNQSKKAETKKGENKKNTKKEQ